MGRVVGIFLAQGRYLFSYKTVGGFTPPGAETRGRFGARAGGPCGMRVSGP